MAARIAVCGTESKALDALQATREMTLLLEVNSWIMDSLMLLMASAVDRPGIPPKRLGGRDLFILACICWPSAFANVLPMARVIPIFLYLNFFFLGTGTILAMLSADGHLFCVTIWLHRSVRWCVTTNLSIFRIQKENWSGPVDALFGRFSITFANLTQL